MKKERAILCICDNNYLFLLGTFLINLREIGQNFDDLIIINEDFSQKTKEKIKNFFPNTIFITYTKEDFCKEFNIDITNSNNFIKRYSYLCYLKLKIFYLLKYYKTVVYLDLDVLIYEKFDELFTLDCNIAWRNGMKFIKKMNVYSIEKNIFANKYAKIYDVQISNTTNSLNGGLIVANDNFDFMKIYDDSIDFTRNFFSDLKAATDELAVAHAAYKNKLNISFLDRKIYNYVNNYQKIISINDKLCHEITKYKDDIIQYKKNEIENTNKIHEYTIQIDKYKKEINKYKKINCKLKKDNDRFQEKISRFKNYLSYNIGLHIVECLKFSTMYKIIFLPFLIFKEVYVYRKYRKNEKIST